MGTKRIASQDHVGTGRIARSVVLCVLLASGGRAIAQSGAYLNVFGGGVPAAAPSRPTEEDRDVSPEETVTKPVRPGVKPLLPVTGAARPDELSRAEQEAIDNLLSPPAGTPLRYSRPPNPRLGRRLGQSIVQRGAAGTRLGGGFDSPSPEAVTYDPRDFLEVDPRDYLDAKVRALSDPRRP